MFTEAGTQHIHAPSEPLSSRLPDPSAGRTQPLISERLGAAEGTAIGRIGGAHAGRDAMIGVLTISEEWCAGRHRGSAAAESGQGHVWVSRQGSPMHAGPFRMGADRRCRQGHPLNRGFTSRRPGTRQHGRSLERPGRKALLSRGSRHPAKKSSPRDTRKGWRQVWKKHCRRREYRGKSANSCRRLFETPRDASTDASLRGRSTFAGSA